MQIKRHCKYFAVLTVLVAIAATVSMNNNHNDQSRIIEKKEYVLLLIKKANEWATVVDISPLSALTHAQYAMGLLWAMQLAAEDQELVTIAKDMGVDLHLLKAMIAKKQDTNHIALVKECKQLTPKVTQQVGGTATPQIQATRYPAVQ